VTDKEGSGRGLLKMTSSIFTFFAGTEKKHFFQPGTWAEILSSYEQTICPCAIPMWMCGVSNFTGILLILMVNSVTTMP